MKTKVKREGKISYFLLPLLFTLLIFLVPLFGEGGSLISGDPKKGEAIYKERFCGICHSIERKGGRIGPDLTNVTIRRSEEWLLRWLKDPKTILPDTIMPTVEWSLEEEIGDLIAYFKTLRKSIKKEMLHTMEPEEAGKRLVEIYDCQACHRIKGEGGIDRYPDLTYVASRRSAEWIEKWLNDPQSIKPETFMPTFSFSSEEIKAIVAYLKTLK